jgi:hypothetical protein
VRLKLLKIVAEMMEEHLDEEHQEETKKDIEFAKYENCKDKKFEEVRNDQKQCYIYNKEKIDTPSNDAMESEKIKTAKGEVLN